jgi:hypothetical protein
MLQRLLLSTAPRQLRKSATVPAVAAAAASQGACTESRSLNRRSPRGRARRLPVTQRCRSQQLGLNPTQPRCCSTAACDAAGATLASPRSVDGARQRVSLWRPRRAADSLLAVGRRGRLPARPGPGLSGAADRGGAIAAIRWQSSVWIPVASGGWLPLHYQSCGVQPVHISLSVRSEVHLGHGVSNCG